VTLPCVIEIASGLVDGLNTVFQLAAPYISGSVEVFLNGQAKRQDYDDGWSELGGNKIQMKQPPELGDVVQVFYRPA
jgi:hypothetical protein